MSKRTKPQDPNTIILKPQSAVEIKFNVTHLRRLLQYYTLKELKQMFFQLMDYGLEGMEERVNVKRGKRFVKIKDTDLYY